MNNSVKIVIVEPSILLRSGMISILQQLNMIQMDVSDITDIDQLKSAFGRQNTDILIINPSVLGTVSLPQIKKDANNSALKCIALQHSLLDHTVLKTYDEVISIYDSAEQICEKLTRMIIKPVLDKRHETLTLREKEIIICIIKGMTNKQIAEKLYLSTHTVISHRRNIAAKLQIHSTAGLTIYAIVNKLVELGEIGDLPGAIGE
ncbi:MAG: LuxR C-terminal-related transcriptional regulator [Dysgonamonadaceae bacterium]|jgi:DNA-binding NarL/FixJ family response regulator|nr:LuxR C-terminal-related transcriptional regulator [Dysgonamonadaceae bacterium]